jgi:predicted RecA/RadA family phage recombinase
MKNYIQPGHVATVTAPRDVASGDGVLVGSMFGVATSDAESDGTVEIQLTGVVELDKTASQAWTVGQRIYWDNSAFVATSTASSNKLIGVAVAAVGSGAGETLGKVRLSAAFTI